MFFVIIILLITSIQYKLIILSLMITDCPVKFITIILLAFDTIPVIPLNGKKTGLKLITINN